MNNLDPIILDNYFYFILFFNYVSTFLISNNIKKKITQYDSILQWK